MSQWRRQMKAAIAIGGIGVVYFFAARFGLALAFSTKQVSAVWPPSGIALAALLIFGLRVWPGIFAGAFLANFFAQDTVTNAFGIALGNTVAGIVGYWVLSRRKTFDRTLIHAKDVLLLLLVAVTSTLVSATGGVINLAIAKIVSWSEFLSVWWVWWMGDSLGIIVITPFVLTWWADPRLRWRGWKSVEALGLFGAAAVAGYLMFSGLIISSLAESHFKFFSFSFLVWAALRFGLRETVSLALLMTGFAVWGAIHEIGPFATTSNLDTQFILLGTFVVVLEIVALLLGAVTAERKRAKDELEQALREKETLVAAIDAQRTALETANRSLSEFAYVASHDLRAPLRAIDMLSQWLATDLEKVLVGEQREQMELLRGRVRRMDRLLSDLLEYARVGTNPEDAESVQLATLTAEAIGLCNVPDGFVVETRVFVDRLHTAQLPLKRVLMNLIGNAIKHRDRDTGKVVITAQDRGEFVEFVISDDGPGIPRQYRERVFQMFQTLQPRDVVEGSGMGLALVKKLVELAGGSIVIEGEGSRGTDVRFTWPKQWRDPKNPAHTVRAHHREFRSPQPV